MLFRAVFERFVTKKPMAVMARAVFENALAPSDLAALFRTEAPVTPRTKHKDTPPVSTPRLLDAVRQGKRPCMGWGPRRVLN